MIRSEFVLTKDYSPASPDNVLLTDIGLKPDTLKALRRAGYNTVDDVLKIEKRRNLFRIRNFGERAAYDLLEAVEVAGYDVSHLWDF